MTEPANDMSLADRPGRLDLYPLQRMTADTEPGQWSAYCPPCDASRERWTVTRPLAVHLPGVLLRDLGGWRWRAWSAGRIDVERGYWWDGASGPAIDDPQAVMASLVHDIVCEPIEGPMGTLYAVQSYMGRHALYRRILRANGAALGRAWYSWAGLVAANWWLMLKD